LMQEPTKSLKGGGKEEGWEAALGGAPTVSL